MPQIEHFQQSNMNCFFPHSKTLNIRGTKQTMVAHGSSSKSNISQISLGQCGSNCKEKSENCITLCLAFGPFLSKARQRSMNVLLGCVPTTGYVIAIVRCHPMKNLWQCSGGGGQFFGAPDGQTSQKINQKYWQGPHFAQSNLPWPNFTKP